MALGERITALRSSSPLGRSSNPPSPAPETVNALRSLGYLSGTTSSGPLESRVDPKDRIRDFEQYGRALALASAGRLAESNDLLEKLRDKLPEVADIWISLGLNQQRLGQYEEAAREFRRALDEAPSNARAHFDLGLCYFRLRQPDDAVKELQASLQARDSAVVRITLARVYLEQKKPDLARAEVQLRQHRWRQLVRKLVNELPQAPRRPRGYGQ